MESADLADLYTRRSDLNERIYKLEAANRAEENAAKVGKAFIFKNGYSLKERWLLYTLVESISDDGYFEVLQFETDSRGRCSIWRDARLSMGNDYIEIPRDQFDAAWESLRTNISSMYKAHSPSRPTLTPHETRMAQNLG